MCGKLPRLQPCQRRPLLDDLVDCTRLQRALRNIPPAIDLAKNAPAFDSSSRKPGVERVHRPTSQINGFVVIGTRRLGAAEMDGKRGEGRGPLDGDWWLGGELLPAQTGNLTATPSARGKSHHQDCPVADITKVVGAAGREHFCQDVAGHRLGAFAFPWPRCRADSKTDRGLQRRGGEDTRQPAPFCQRRPTGKPPAHRIGRMRPGGSKEPLLAQALLDISWHAVVRIDVALFRLPEMVGHEFQS